MISLIEAVKSKNIEKKIQSILMEEKMYWKQRSRVDWLKAGDKTQNSFMPKLHQGKGKTKLELKMGGIGWKAREM